MNQPQSEELIASAVEFGPIIRNMREELDATHHLPATLAQKMTAAGFFQLHVPRELGGLECSPLTSFRVIEELAKVDGAVGWCAMIASAISISTAWLKPDVARKLFGSPADVRMAGSARPEGQALVVEGGYRVSGQWDFASGVHHANWLMCTCRVIDGEQPRLTAAGAPELRSLLVPAELVTIQDTWSVVGLQGTGSHDFVVDDVFVPTSQDVSRSQPAEHSGPLYDARLSRVNTWTLTAATALGIARGALDAFVELATSKSSTMSASMLRERALVQNRLAEAEAIVSAARAYVLYAVGAAWEAVGAEDTASISDPMPPIVQARLAITHSIHEAVRAVDLVFHAAGTNAVYRKHPIERYFRDIHVAVQHAAALPIHYESAGKVLLGYAPKDVGW